MLIIHSKSEAGFYRAGLHFTRESVQIDPKALSAAQLAAIRDEPMLVVTEDDAQADAAPAAPHAGKKAKKAD